MNLIEDPRVNNFLTDAYPAFDEKMQQYYIRHMAAIAQHQEIPNFALALSEYFRLWLADRLDQEMVVDEKLPELVQQVITRTLPAARDAWWTYPTRTEADQSEEIITSYSKRAYEIVRDLIWPEMILLLDQDEQDLTRQLQEQAKQQENRGGEGAGQGSGKENDDRNEPQNQKNGGEQKTDTDQPWVLCRVLGLCF